MLATARPSCSGIAESLALLMTSPSPKGVCRAERGRSRDRRGVHVASCAAVVWREGGGETARRRRRLLQVVVEVRHGRDGSFDVDRRPELGQRPLVGCVLLLVLKASDVLGEVQPAGARQRSGGRVVDAPGADGGVRRGERESAVWPEVVVAGVTDASCRHGDVRRLLCRYTPVDHIPPISVLIINLVAIQLTRNLSSRIVMPAAHFVIQRS